MSISTSTTSPSGPNPNSSSSSPSPRTIRLLFVCLGNICRSPMAHGIMQHLTNSLPASLPSSTSTSTSQPTPTILLDSAGMGAYHTGSAPDPRTLSTLRKHGIRDFSHAARKVRVGDFEEFDYVLAMDEENLEDLRAVRRRAEREGDRGGAEDGLARLCLFGDFGGRKNEVIDDPWYGGGEGFEVAYKQCVRFSKGLLKEILGEEVEVEV